MNILIYVTVEKNERYILFSNNLPRTVVHCGNSVNVERQYIFVRKSISKAGVRITLKTKFFGPSFIFMFVFMRLNQGWANSALRGICVSETISSAHVVDSFLSLLLRVTMLCWRYVIIKCKRRVFSLT